MSRNIRCDKFNTRYQLYNFWNFFCPFFSIIRKTAEKFKKLFLWKYQTNKLSYQIISWLSEQCFWSKWCIRTHKIKIEKFQCGEVAKGWERFSTWTQSINFCQMVLCFRYSYFYRNHTVNVRMTNICVLTRIHLGPIPLGL